MMIIRVGAIDESSINQLSLVSYLVKNIAVSADSHETTMYDLSYFAPKFLWILRDFVLEIRDVRGNVATPQQYLESALCDVSHIRNLSENSRKTREGIVNFFRERDCITMVLPCFDEKDIKRLDTLPKDSIRPEFNSQVNKIRNKIFTQCGPKKLNGTYLNSRMYLKMVAEYVKSINSGSVPMIQNAWQNVLENECVTALETAKETYDRAFAQRFSEKNKALRKTELNRALKELRDQANTAFNVINSVKESDEDMFDKYFNELGKHIERKEKIQTDQNNNLSDQHDLQRFGAYSKELSSKLSKNHYNSHNMGELNSDYEKLIEGFDRDSSGTNRTKTLCENLKPLHFLIFQRYSESVVAEASKDMNDKIKAKNLSEENQRVLNDKLKNLDNRIERTNDGTDNELERLHRENSNMRDQLEEANNQRRKEVKSCEEQIEALRKETATLEMEIAELHKKKKGICG